MNRPTNRPAVGLEDPASRLRAHAARFADTKAALIYQEAGSSQYRQLTYAELDARSDQHVSVLRAAGIGRGTKTVLMVPVGPELFAVVFALFKLGAVPVVVDPGQGLRRMLGCLRTVGAEAFIGTTMAQLIRLLRPGSFRGVRCVVTTGRRFFRGGQTLRRRPAGEPVQPEVPVVMTADDLLLISFTTGSTGPAKGVETTYGALAATARQTRLLYGTTAEDVCLVTAPAFAFLHLWEGATCVLAKIAPGRIADADLGPIIDAVDTFAVTAMFGSPALLDPLARQLQSSGRRLPSLRSVVSGGAPVSDEVVGRLQEVIADDAQVQVSYGATEAVPITSISAPDLLAQAAGMHAGGGSCVGRPAPDLALRIITSTDEPLPLWSDSYLAGPGRIGEIVISGPAVSPRYHASIAANAAAKILDGERFWHRTGDLGRVDDAGRLWFCGRKSQVVHTAAGPLHTVRCEGVFNAHPQVYRTALVGLGPAGSQLPVVCVELRSGVPDRDWPRIERELRTLAERHEVTAVLDTFLRHPAFPVDIRHNAKIQREQLARWAATPATRAPAR